METEREPVPSLEILIVLCAGYITAGEPYNEQLLMDIREKLDEYFIEQQGTLH
jgi:hypothetical protein|tara:strand:- start:2550 stop:2708 length:159 start_codon:yes stop_codon:yes gene_type:complete